MISLEEMLKVLHDLEGDKFHKNRGEKTYTTPYGIYAHYWKSSDVITYVDSIATIHGIDLESVAGRRRMTKLVKGHRVIRKMFERKVYNFFMKNFTNQTITDTLGRDASISFFAFAVNSGLYNATKTLQRVLGVTVDGKFGRKSLRALFNLQDIHSDKEISQMYNTEAYRYYRSLGTWKLFGKGWVRRLKYLGWNMKRTRYGR